MNLRQVEIMDAMVAIHAFILRKQAALLALLRERKALPTAHAAPEPKNNDHEAKLCLKSSMLLKEKWLYTFFY